MYEKIKPFELFKQITGKQTIPEGFAAPFIKAFATLFPTSDCNTIHATSIACALFLSTIHCKFASEKLHLFFREARESYSIISFNCKLYDQLANAMSLDNTQEFTLLNSENNPEVHPMTNGDIFDAFDFVTNF